MKMKRTKNTVTKKHSTTETYDGLLFSVSDLLEQGMPIICIGRVAVKELFGRQHGLIGGLASAAAASHAIGDHAQQAARIVCMRQQANLILLIVAVPFMDARGRGDSITFGHLFDRLAL